MNRTIKQKNKNLFRRDTPLYITLLVVVLSGVLVYYFFPQPEEGRKVTVISTAPQCNPARTIVRSKDFHFTHRVFLADYKNENTKLASIKERVNEFISRDKFSNIVSDVSVYYRNMNDGSWFEINGDNKYNPASLMKVSFMIAMLKQAEKFPGLLDKQLYFDKHFQEGYSQNIKSFSLEEKKSYSIRELLYDMIVYSDNDALTLVAMNVNPDVYTKLFSDLGMTPPPVRLEKGTEYSMNVIDCCKFFRVLYNSAYLNEEHSEFALELLTKSTYKEGLTKNITGNFPVAHKFGERVVSDVHELHEVGIFYVHHQPYMLGVMSTGRDLNQLSSVLSQISDVVYRESGNLN